LGCGLAFLEVVGYGGVFGYGGIFGYGGAFIGCGGILDMVDGIFGYGGIFRNVSKVIPGNRSCYRS
jgi:hypothetical protein